MTTITSYCTRRLPLRGFPQLPTVVLLATAVGSVGCTNAPENDQSPGGNANAVPDAFLSSISKEELGILGAHISPWLSAEFTSDGKWIVVAGADGVSIHDAASMECVHWFNSRMVKVSPDGASFLLEHPSGSRELRSIPEGKLLWRLPEDIATRPMRFSEDGQYIVCGYRDLLRVETREVVYRAPKSYYFDRFGGGDTYRDPADHPGSRDDDEETSLADQSVLPYIYRTTLRHDARPLITLRSGLCSPSGQFMIVQTGEEDSSYEPYYSFINRKTGKRLFSDVSSSDALFFHNDDYVYCAGSVCRTENGAIPYALAEGITAVALNSDETMFAVGWQNGKVAVLDPMSGGELFRLTVEQHVDNRSQKCGDIVSLAFSSDSKRLAAVGRKLTVIDVPSQTISQVLHLGRGSRDTGDRETTSPAEIAFSADGSRLLLTIRRRIPYYSRPPRALVLQSADLRQRRHLCSPHSFSRPIYFSSDCAWAIVPTSGRGLQLWNTDAEEPIVELQREAFQLFYHEDSVVPDFPNRHPYLGRLLRSRTDELIMYPWTIEFIESNADTKLPEGAKDWLATWVSANPQNTSSSHNMRTLDFPPRQWLLRVTNRRIHQLYDLVTKEVHPPNATQYTPQPWRVRDRRGVPEVCWGSVNYRASAFSPDGSHLLVCCGKHEPWAYAWGLFEMPSGRLLRVGESQRGIGRIHIASNNRIAAISTDFYEKTWIIDLQTGETLVELPKGGKCEFSPDGRYAHVGDRYGDSRYLLATRTGERVDFERADCWSFSPNSRYVVAATRHSSLFLDLETGEETDISGEIHRTGIRNRMTTKLELPYHGGRFLCTERGETTLFDLNTATSLAKFHPVEIARQCAKDIEEKPTTYKHTSASGYLYTPDEQDFVYVVEGSDAKEDDNGRRVSQAEATKHSTQLLVGDLETGRKIQCSVPNWSRSRLQHKLFAPDGAHLITITADRMVCWKLHPLELAWETQLSDRWTDPETGSPFAPEETLGWSLGYSIHPGDQSILVAKDGIEAIMFSLATGGEEQRFGPLPINSVLRFGADGAYLQVGFRSDRSMRLYDAISGRLVRTYHFTNGGAELHRFDPIDSRD